MVFWNDLITLLIQVQSFQKDNVKKFEAITKNGAYTRFEICLLLMELEHVFELE